MPERTWPELHPAAIPGDYLPAGNALCGDCTCFLKVWIPLNLDSVCPLREGGVHYGHWMCRAEKRYREPAIPIFAENHSPEQRRSQGGPVIAGGRLYVDVVKEGGPQELSVRCAVQSHTAGHS